MSVICKGCSGNFDEAKIVNNKCPLCGYPEFQDIPGIQGTPSSVINGHVVHYVGQGGRRWLRVLIYTILLFVVFTLLSGFMNNSWFFKIGIILSPVMSFFIAGRKTKLVFEIRTDEDGYLY